MWFCVSALSIAVSVQLRGVFYSSRTLCITLMASPFGAFGDSDCYWGSYLQFGFSWEFTRLSRVHGYLLPCLHDNECKF